MKTPTELSLDRIKNAVEALYFQIEAKKNQIEGLKIAERFIEEAIYQEQKDKERQDAKVSGVA